MLCSTSATHPALQPPNELHSSKSLYPVLDATYMLWKMSTSIAGRLAIGKERASLVADLPPCFWPASEGDRPLLLPMKCG